MSHSAIQLLQTHLNMMQSGSCSGRSARSITRFRHRPWTVCSPSFNHHHATPLSPFSLRYVASYTIGRFGRSLDYSGQYKISVAVNGFSIPGSPFSSPACVGFEYHPRIFALEGLDLVGTASCVTCHIIATALHAFSRVFSFENADGRTAANAETLAGGFVRVVHGASTTKSASNQAGAMWFADLMPVGEGFVVEFEFQLSDALLHCRVSSPTQVCHYSVAV